MQTNKLLFILLLIFIPACSQSPRVTYSNPIIPHELHGGADPDVLFYNNTYYMYSTNPGNHVFTSTDLLHWTRGPGVLPATLKNIWAPEVILNSADDKFYMYYTDHYKIAVAVADQPDEVFQPLGYLVAGAIDPDVFRDDDGRLYLYFTNTPAFTMYCVPLKSPTETGGPVTRLFQISQDWEKHSFPINEGPWMMKHDGTCYLLYSGSNGQSIYYAVGYATAPTPIGPFTKFPGNPFFQNLKANVYGPGHGAVVRDRNGQLWHLYAQKTSPKIGWQRDVCLDPIAFSVDGTLHGTPTHGVVQDAPDCNPNALWAPDADPRGAVFNKSVSVTLSTHSANAEIRYTLDGSNPSSHSPLYESPITLGRTTTIKSRTFAARQKPSAITTTRFTQTSEPLAPNPSPDAAPGNPPFPVFPKPNPHWTPPKKP